MKNTIHVQARAVVLKQDHILLCKTKGLDINFYFLPGGHVEHGESAEQTVLRELCEEVGVDFELQRFLGCFEYSFDPRKTIHAKCHTHEYTLIFLAHADTLTPPGKKLKQPEDHIEIHWLPLSNLVLTDLRPEPLKELIPKWLTNSFNEALYSQMDSIKV